jgi:PAS domain S-box-containing protein
LKESEKGLSEAQKMAHLGNWDWDLINDKMRWSDEMCQIFGRTHRKSDTFYDEVLSCTHPDDRDHVDKAVKRALKGKPFGIDQRIILASGEERIIRAKGKVVFDEKNSPIRMIGTVQDITESKKAEEKIKTLANAVESSDDAIVTESLDGIITSWNKGAEQIYGYSAEEVLGKSASILEPDNLKGEIKQLIEKVKQEEKIRHYETSRSRKDGTIINVSITLSPIYAISGKFMGVSCIARDITEGIKAKEALRLSSIYNRSLFEASLDPLVTIGHDGKITDLNTSMEFVTGYSRDELIGTDFTNYFTEPEKARERYIEAFEKGFVSDYVLEILHRNGRTTPVLFNASVYKDESGKIIGVFAAARDITERKKAEEKIRTLASAVESSNDAIGTMSLNGVITSWNKGAEQVYGYSAEEILEKCVSILSPPNLDKETIKLIKKIKQGERIHNFETLRLRKDGKTINVSITLSPIFDIYGRLTAISFISRDITERKRSEEKLRESEEKYRNIVETANEGILITDSESIITYVNNKMVGMLGYSQEENIGRPIWSFISEEYKPIVKLNLEKRRQGISDSYELKLIRKDGSPLWTLISAKPLFDEKGKYMGAMSLLTDITKRKEAEEKRRESEEKYRNIVETANEGISIIDAETIVTYANKKLAEMLGYILEEFVGRPTWDFISEEGKKSAKLNQEKRRQGINESYELKLIRKDGSSIWTLINAKPLFDEEGKYMGSMSLLTDITELKKAEKVLKSKLEELARSNAELEQFAYVSSHDLQEPLRMVSSYSGCLKTQTISTIG